ILSIQIFHSYLLNSPNSSEKKSQKFIFLLFFFSSKLIFIFEIRKILQCKKYKHKHLLFNSCINMHDTQAHTHTHTHTQTYSCSYAHRHLFIHSFHSFIVSFPIEKKVNSG
ncbi:hypothetical protein LOAG_13458, partial [Loa loa]